MSTTYEVRRGAAVITSKPDAGVALSFAALHSHFPGQLEVFVVIREEYQITEAPSAPIPLRGSPAIPLRGQRSAR